MSFPSWLASLFAPRRRPIRKATRRTGRLSVELLEDRVTPSTLATHALIEAPTVGIASDAVTTTGAWMAVTNDLWLHPTAGNGSGTGNGTAIFTLDANTGPTRTGTLTIAGETLTVTQAGSTYLAAFPLTSPVGGSSVKSPIAVDAAGDVYFSSGNNIDEWNAATQSVSTVISGLAANSSQSYQIEVDRAGNLYIAENGDGYDADVVEWNAATQTITTVVPATAGKTHVLMGIAVDTAGNVYTGSLYDGVYEWNAANPNGLAITTTGVDEMGIDGAGNVYYASPHGEFLNVNLAVDGAGNQFFNSLGGGNAPISKFNNATKTTIVIDSNNAICYGVGVDADDNIYVSGATGLIEIPVTFVSTGPVSEPATAGSDSLLPVLDTQPLLGQFAPTSNQSWLTITGVTGDVVSYSFTQNTTRASRTANITVLGKTIVVTQSATAPPTVTTPTAASITGTSALLGGDVTSAGVGSNGSAASITQRGIVYAPTATNANPTIGGTGVLQVNDPSNTTGVFTDTVNGLQVGTGYSYEAFATSSVGTSYSPVATFSTLTSVPPAVTTQPTSPAVSALNTVSFTAAASGTPAPTVQWYVNTNNGAGFTPISGATSATLSFTATGDLSGDEYEAVFTNSAGSITTNAVTLTVNPLNATVTLGSLTPTYDGMPEAATATTNATGTSSFTFTYNGSTTIPTAAGSYTVVGTLVNTNYQGSDTETLVIAQAALMIVAANANGVEGQPPPTFTGTISGIQNSDPITATYSTTAGAANEAGSYQITPTLSDGGAGNLANYSITSTNGAFTVADAPLTAGALTPPTGTGPLTYSATLAGLANPNALAFDSSGNLYVANYDNGTVSKFAPGATTASATLTGVSGPFALVFDSSGNLFVANRNPNAASNGTTISKFAAASLAALTSGSLAPTASLTGLTNPYDMAFDSSGNLFVANFGTTPHTGTVSEFAPGATTPSATLTGVDNPPALAVDGHGDLFVVNAGNNTVSEYAPGATTPTATLTGLNYPNALAFDGSGNLYVANYGGTTVSKFAPGALSPTATLTGLSAPYNLTVDASGNLYVANVAGGNNTVSIFTASALTGTGTIAATSTLSGNGLTRPNALAFDGSGNLYVANFGVTTVTKFAPQPIAEGQAFTNKTVFHFTDGDPNGTASDYTAVVKLNGLTIATLTSTATTSGQIVASAGGGFDVQLSYALPEELTNATFSVTVTDAGGASTSASTSTFIVADAPLTAGTLSASGGVEGLIPTSLSAAFTDANTGASTSDYSGTINWGDGTTTNFTSSAVTGSNGSYTVSGSYQYAAAGNFNITVAINDVGGSSTSVNGSTTVARAASFTTTVGAGPFTYDGSSQVGGSGTVTGAGGLSTSATSVTYSANSDGTGVADQTDAGTYYVTAHYAGDANHLPSDGLPVAITISQANATVAVTGFTGGTYDGNQHTQTVTVTGVHADGQLYTTSLTGTNAGSYSQAWSFSSNPNYTPVSGTLSFSIGQATLPVVVTSDLMLAGLTGRDEHDEDNHRDPHTTPPPLTGTLNGIAFTGSTTFTTAQGDTLTVTLSSVVTGRSDVGVYAIVATVTGAATGNYMQPASANMYVVTTGQDSGTGAQNVSFWDKQSHAQLITATDLTALNQLDLVNNNRGSDFDPTTAAQLQRWFRSDTDSIATALSIQLAVMDLNVTSGNVSATSVVYAGNLLKFVGSAYSVTGLDGGGFITVGNLMTLANNALASYSSAGKGDGDSDGDDNPMRNYLDALEDALEAANNNQSFVQQPVPAGS